MSKPINYIITACDNKFYRCFIQLLYTYKRHKEYQNSNFILFDLGLDDNQRSELKILEKKYGWFEYRSFDFSKYPSYFDPKNQNYAWKPTLIHQVFEEKKGNIFYLDSANIILRNLKPIWDIIASTGTYVPLCGTGSLGEWTLPPTLDYLEVSDEHRNSRNRAGNTIGFSYQNEAVKSLVTKWKDLASIEECIYPQGATRYNHKSDQSILTILLLQSQERGEINLTKQEVDISCSHPTKYLSVRNKFPRFLPLKPGWFAYHYFNLLRFFDILINRIKGN